MSENTRVVVDAILRVVVAILLVAGGWVGSQIIEHGVRLTAIESNRYTDEDSAKHLESHRAVETEMNARFAQILVRLEQIRAEIPSEVPPAWWIEEVRSSLRDVKDRVKILEDKRK